jgi:hypothetical protein
MAPIYSINILPAASESSRKKRAKTESGNVGRSERELSLKYTEVE